MSTYAKLFGALIVSVAVTLPAFGLNTFVTEVQTQHCPKDMVVWLNFADHDLAH